MLTKHHSFILLFIFIIYFIEGLPGIRYYSRHCECSSEPKKQKLCLHAAYSSSGGWIISK